MSSDGSRSSRPSRGRGQSDQTGRKPGGAAGKRARRAGPPGPVRAKGGPPRKGGPSRKGGGPSRTGAKKTGRSPRDRDLAGPKDWGRVARRGAAGLDEPPRDPGVRPRRGRSDEAATTRRPPPPPGRSVPSAADLQRSAAGAVDRARGPAPRTRKPLGARRQGSGDPAVALSRLVGSPRDASLAKRLDDAARSFQAERFKEARGLLGPVVKEAPELPEGRELMGLTQYRLGRWTDAIEELEAFRDLTASTEQHPVLADCHRALGRWRDVEALWEELGEASPAPEIVTEGRIVTAGALADRGDLGAAIRLLEKGWKLPKRPRPDHLRRAYALGDLYDRAGRTARARELFGWVARHDPGLADVRGRLRTLS